MAIKKIKERFALKAKETVPGKNTVKDKKIVPEELGGLISEKAYKLYEKRGCAHGDDQRDWYEAEKAVRTGAGKK